MSPRLTTAAALDDRQNDAVGRECSAGWSSRWQRWRRPAPLSVILAERGALVEHPVVPAAGQRLGRYRCARSPSCRGRTASRAVPVKTMRRPVRRHPRASGLVARGGKTAAVRANGPGGVLREKRCRRRRCQDGPAPAHPVIPFCITNESAYGSIGSSHSLFLPSSLLTLLGFIGLFLSPLEAGWSASLGCHVTEGATGGQRNNFGLPLFLGRCVRNSFIFLSKRKASPAAAATPPDRSPSQTAGPSKAG